MFKTARSYDLPVCGIVSFEIPSHPWSFDRITIIAEIKVFFCFWPVRAFLSVFPWCKNLEFSHTNAMYELFTTHGTTETNCVPISLYKQWFIEQFVKDVVGSKTTTVFESWPDASDPRFISDHPHSDSPTFVMHWSVSFFTVFGPSPWCPCACMTVYLIQVQVFSSQKMHCF